MRLAGAGLVLAASALRCAGEADLQFQPSEVSLKGERFTFVDSAGRSVPVFTFDQAPTVVGGVCATAECTVRRTDIDVAERARSERIQPIEGMDGPWRLDVSVTATVGGALVQVRRRMFVVRDPERLPVIRRLRELRQAGDPAAAVAEAESIVASGAEWEALWAEQELARALSALSEHRRAARVWASSAARAGSMGLVSEQARRHAASGFEHLYQHDFAEVLAAVEAARRLGTEFDRPDSVAFTYYLEGLVATRTGDLLESARLHERALREWPDHSDPIGRLSITTGLADLRSRLGQYDEALGLLSKADQAHGDQLNPLVRYKFGTHRYWTALQAAVRGGMSFDPNEILDDIRRSARRAKQLGRTRVLDLVNLAHAQHAFGRHDEAMATLETLGPPPEHRSELEWDDYDLLRGAIELELGQLDAAEPHLRKALREGFAGDRPTETVWRARHQLARLSERRGDLDDAARIYSQALADRDEVASYASIQGGRATYLSSRSEVVLDAAALHLRRGDPWEALSVVEAERASLLSELDTGARRARLTDRQRRRLVDEIGAYERLRDDFEQRLLEAEQLLEGERPSFSSHPGDRGSVIRGRRLVEQARNLRDRIRAKFEDVQRLLDEYAPRAMPRAGVAEARGRLQPGEAVATSFRAPGAVVHHYWITTSTVAHVVGERGMRELLRARLHSIEHVYSVAGPSDLLTDLHTARLGDRLLIEDASVSYLPFIGAVPSAAAVPNEPKVVVADPTGDLPHSRREVGLLQSPMACACRSNDRALVGSEAKRRTVLEALRRAGLFHFSGHGRLSPQSPWDAHLLLARSERLSLEDVLIARPRVGLAVLNGCETGARGSMGGSFEIGMADAFLLVGTRSVLASDRAIPDREAYEFMRLFYADGVPDRPGDALRRAYVEARLAGLDVWRSYRLHGAR